MVPFAALASQGASIISDIVDSHEPFLSINEKAMSSTYKSIETEWETVIVQKAAKTTEDDEETTKPVGQTIGKCVINLQDFD